MLVVADHAGERDREGGAEQPQIHGQVESWATRAGRHALDPGDVITLRIVVDHLRDVDHHRAGTEHARPVGAHSAHAPPARFIRRAARARSPAGRRSGCASASSRPRRVRRDRHARRRRGEIAADHRTHQATRSSWDSARWILRPNRAIRAPAASARLSSSKVSRVVPLEPPRMPTTSDGSCSVSSDERGRSVVGGLEEQRTFGGGQAGQRAQDAVVDVRTHLIRREVRSGVGVEDLQEVPHADGGRVSTELGVRLQRRQVVVEVGVEGDRVQHQVAERPDRRQVHGPERPRRMLRVVREALVPDVGGVVAADRQRRSARRLRSPIDPSRHKAFAVRRRREHDVDSTGPQQGPHGIEVVLAGAVPTGTRQTRRIHRRPQRRSHRPG